jgi:hypothetical protein
MKTKKGKIFKVVAEGDTLYIQAVDKASAGEYLREIMGDIPESLLKWSTVEKLPKGEEFL